MTDNATALVVDDEPDIRELLEITLNKMGISTSTAANLSSAKKLLSNKDFDICLTDMKMPDGSGIELVRYIQKNRPLLPVAVITAFGSMETAVEALKEGAFDFVSKPVDLERLRELVNTALRLGNSMSGDGTSGAGSRLTGQSGAIRQLEKQITKLARSQAPVHISGPSGSGKELVARLIHELGPRNEGPFMPVNCGAIPAELMESEFFGHVKGSFTGAIDNKEGLFKAADGGTLFLDEVADLPLSMQVKLLRAIQEKTIKPVGSTREIPVNVRLLSATHKNLARLVEQQEFRQDLFFRINVIEVRVPALRERKEDIPELCQHILGKISQDWEVQAPSISSGAMKILQDYDYPGNVRELENILERGFTMCEEDVIEAEHIQLTSTPSPEAATGTATNFAPLPDGQPLEEYLQEVEKSMILKALEETRWNRTAAAKKLGMTFRSLRYRLKKLGIDHSRGSE